MGNLEEIECLSKDFFSIKQQISEPSIIRSGQVSPAVPCESLVSREFVFEISLLDLNLEAFSFHFSLSK